MTQDLRFRTHEVCNQPAPLAHYNAWTSDTALAEAVAREGGGWADHELTDYGGLVGGEMRALGEAANRQRPVLQAFDPYGRRIDAVDFHPAYHRLLALATQHGVHSFGWNHADRAGAQVARAALLYLHTQADAGTACPLTMSFAAVAALRHAPTLASHWLPRLTAADYDPRSLPAGDKRACTMGMGMTEKQGGSDVRSNSTRAERLADGRYRLIGHKWFFSAPMSDAHLVLARDEAGLGCFLVPRVLADGSRNAVRVQALKDKLGDWSNASAEVEFAGALAERVGEAGRGIATILEMVALTRLDCMIASAGLMRQAVVQALHHCRQRSAFGRRLIEQPLMQNVLADLIIESEAAVALAMRVARAVDAAPRDPREAAFARIATAIGKYWVCKRTPSLVNEAQECLGGLGYVETTAMTRLYRQAPLNSIWEGSGNVVCLDVLRALGREPACREALFKQFERARGCDHALDAAIDTLAHAIDDDAALEVRSRAVVEDAALALQAAILLDGDASVAEAFCRSRIARRHGLAFGTLAADLPMSALIERALPAI